MFYVCATVMQVNNKCALSDLVTKTIVRKPKLVSTFYFGGNMNRNIKYKYQKSDLG